MESIHPVLKPYTLSWNRTPRLDAFSLHFSIQKQFIYKEAQIRQFPLEQLDSDKE